MIVARAINQNEKDLLIGFETKQLTIKSLDKKVVVNITPTNGFWSHDALEAVDYDKHSPLGWEAYLGAQWIGSSEV